MIEQFCYCCGKRLVGEGDRHWHESCVRNFFGTKEFPDISLLKEKLDTLAKEFLEGGNAVSGVQRKLSLAVSKETKGARLTLLEIPSGYIAKTTDPEIPFLPEYEQTTMLMAQECQIPVVLHGLVALDDEKTVYLSKRIDRDGKRKIPMEDFCQLSGKLTEYKYQGSYESCYRKILRPYSSMTTLDTIRFFNLILFSYLVGNTDMHLKNFSLYDNGQGYRLTPAYDLVPAELLVGQKEMALTVNGKRKELTQRDFLVFAQNMDIPEGLTRNLLLRMERQARRWEGVLSTSPLPERERKRYQAFLGERRNRFFGTQN